MATIIRQKAKAALFQHVKIDNQGRWIWTGPLNRVGGYGRLFFQGKVWYASRLCYEIFIGEIPEGLEIDHKNGNKDDISPSNLEAVTRLVNAGRAAKRGRYQGRGSYLSEQQVLTMKSLKAAGVERKKILEAFKGIPAGTIDSIIQGKRWAWLQVPGS